MLMIPMLSVTGTNSSITWRTRGSRQSMLKVSRKSIRRSAELIISSCTTVATSHAIAYAYSASPP